MKKTRNSNSNEFLKQMNLNFEVEPINVNEVIRKMLSTYVNILLNERLAETYELLCCLDTEGHFIYICPNHFKAMGFESHELVGMNGFEIIYPDDAEKMNDLMSELLHTKQPKEMVYRIKHKKGHWLTMQSICTPYIVDNEVAALINFSNRISG